MIMVMMMVMMMTIGDDDEWEQHLVWQWSGSAGAWCPFRTDQISPQPRHPHTSLQPSHISQILTHFLTQFLRVTFVLAAFLVTDILGVSFCILELNQISPRRRAAPAHIPHGNQFGNALLLDHLFLLLLLLHSFLLLDHQSPPSGFANPLTGSKSESLV